MSQLGTGYRDHINDGSLLCQRPALGSNLSRLLEHPLVPRPRSQPRCERCVSPSRARLAAALCRQPSPAGGHGTATAERPPLKTAATQTEITDCTCQSPTARTAAAQAAQGDFTSPFPSQKRTEVCSRHCWVSSALTYRCSASPLTSQCKPENPYSSPTLGCPHRKIFLLLLRLHPPLQK